MKRSIVLSVLVAVLASAHLCAYAKEKKTVEPFDRGIGRQNSVFIPQGTVGAGVSFSYNNYSIGNGAADSGYSMLFNLLGDIHGNMLSF